jgi:hypothetical protein
VVVRTATGTVARNAMLIGSGEGLIASHRIASSCVNPTCQQTAFPNRFAHAWTDRRQPAIGKDVLISRAWNVFECAGERRKVYCDIEGMHSPEHHNTLGVVMLHVG